MYRNVFSFLLGLAIGFLPLIVNAQVIVGRQGFGLAGYTDSNLRGGILARYQDNPAIYYNRYGTYEYPISPYYGVGGYPTSLYDSYDGIYGYYPSYSNYPIYPNTYMYPSYRPYYYNSGMYNPNTIFVNPPSSLNYPGYPAYSETYIYR